MPVETYPAKNRRPTDLPILRIEIEHAGGIDVNDPNGIIMAVLGEPWRLADLQPVPGWGSDISMEPAVLYRADDLEVALTPLEYIRLRPCENPIVERNLVHRRWPASVSERGPHASKLPIWHLPPVPTANFHTVWSRLARPPARRVSRPPQPPRHGA